jgi:PKD domain
MSTTNPVPSVPSLIGSVTVQPTSVQPGQPVLVAVCDASGKPISDPTITVIIQGVSGSSRYFQFPAVGTITLWVSAAQGQVTQTAQASVTVAGVPMAFRKSLTAPVVKEMPIIQISSVLGQPYAAAFALGNPPSISGALAAAVNKSNATNIATVSPAKPLAVPVNAPTTAKVAISRAALIAPTSSVPAVAIAPEKVALALSSVTPTSAVIGTIAEPTDALGIELTKTLATLPPTQVTRIAPTSVKTGATTTATLSAVLTAMGGLQITPEATGYRWDFGDGQTLTTQSPNATHDYSASIQAGDLTRSFNVTCTVAHDSVTVTRTLVLHSAYGLCKRLGIIVPRVTGSAYAKFNQVAFSASMTVYNLEATPITLNSMACVPLSDAASYAPPAPKFTTMQNPVTVGAKSTSAIAVYIPVSELQVAGAQINSFAVYYSGSMQAGAGKTVPVRFSYVFRIALADQWVLKLPASSAFSGANWNLTGVLGAVSGVVTHPSVAVSQAGGQVLDPATKTVAITLPSNTTDLKTQSSVQSAIDAGMTSIAQNATAPAAKGPAVFPPAKGLGGTPAPSPKPIDLTYDPLSPPPVAAGNECYPDDISDADAAAATAAQLVCQLTTQVETVTVPSAFQNALQGDIILSPAPVGTGDMIAALFKALTPPQHHGHSGMMTANFYEITHCTASPQRISSNLNKDVLGIPTSLNPDLLQYAWPGSMTQSIDDATTELSYLDPGNTSYSLQSFNTDSEGEGYEVIPPLVIKPLPENEATVRTKLRAAADTARSKGAHYDSSGKLQTKGGCYYSFYCYTNPQISAGFGDAAGADAGWAQGMSPAVCSSFVWLSLKESGIPLVTANQYETLADFSATAVAGGAQVGPQTLDGLTYYPAAERVAAGNALYQLFMEQALDQEGGFGTIPGINQAIAGPLADQLLNIFASGNPNLAGSSAWQNPGDGNAVSPDNIIFWNPPYYGYAEPLQYLPRHTEQYTVSKWTKKPATSGSIKGKVTLDGNPVASAHVWVYLPGGDTHTASDGSYTLSNIPIGAYSLKAQAVATTNGISVQYTNGETGQSVTLTSGSPNVTENLSLQGNLLPFRRLDISYSISCDHGDYNPFNTHGIQKGGPYSRSLDVNPGQVTNSLTYTYDYNGGGYFHIDYVFSIALLQDYSIEVTLTGTMYDDNNPPNFQTQYTLPPFNVPMGGTWSGWTNMENSNGYHNGPANFTFSVTNNQQTG